MEEPYIKIPTFKVLTGEIFYNPKYGDKRICECGHQYYRHFDSYDNNFPCGCKYCSCFEFEEKNNV